MNFTEILSFQLLYPTINPRAHPAHQKKAMDTLHDRFSKNNNTISGTERNTDTQDLFVDDFERLGHRLQICCTLCFQLILITIVCAVAYNKQNETFRFHTNYPELYLFALNYVLIMLIVYGLNENVNFCNALWLLIFTAALPIAASALIFTVRPVILLINSSILTSVLVGFTLSNLCLFKMKLTVQSIFAFIALSINMMILSQNGVLKLSEIRWVYSWLYIAMMILVCLYLDNLINLLEKTQNVTRTVANFYCGFIHLLIAVLIWISKLWA